MKAKALPILLWETTRPMPACSRETLSKENQRLPIDPPFGAGAIEGKPNMTRGIF
jgi:hypothetical protein